MFLRTVCCFTIFAAGMAWAAPKSDPEFPNYFLPEKFWMEKVNPSSLSEEDSKEVDHALSRNEEAMGSLLRRLTIPVVFPGHTRAESVPIFPYVQEKLDAEAARRRGKPMDALPSSGIIRSLEGYLYEKAWEGMHQNPPVRPETTLKKISEDKHPLSGEDILGAGSDFDILLKTVDGSVLDGHELIPYEDVVFSIVNSLRNHYQVKDYDGLSRAIFPLGDAKGYEEQITLSTSQGGNTADFLAFNLRTHHLVSPPTLPQLARDVVAGVRGFTKAAPGVARRSGDDTALARLLRTATELPYGELDPESEKVFDVEYSRVMHDLRKSGLTPKAIEQIGKGIRNARIAAGNNKIYRASEHSPEGKLLALMRAGSSNPNETSLFPKFVVHEPIPPEGRSVKGIPAGALIRIDEYIERYTDQGILYHGSPDAAKAIGILRGTLVRTVNENLIYGSGGFAAKNPEKAMEYAGKDGMVFNLRPRRDVPLRIVDMNRVMADPELKAEFDRIAARHPGQSLFEVLGSMGADIVVNAVHETAIQNTDAIEFPKGFADLVRSYTTIVSNPLRSPEQRLAALKTYTQVRDIADAIGATDLPAASTLREEMITDYMKRATSASEPILRFEAAETLEALEVKDPNIQSLWKKASIQVFLEPGHSPEKLRVVQSMAVRQTRDPEILRAAASSVLPQQLAVRDTWGTQARAKFISQISYVPGRDSVTDPEVLGMLGKELPHLKSTEAEHAIWTLIGSGSRDPQVVDAWIGALDHSNSTVRNVANQQGLKRKIYNDPAANVALKRLEAQGSTAETRSRASWLLKARSNDLIRCVQGAVHSMD